MYRSFLYVPASSDRFIAKAASRNADAIVLDVEDGVAPEQKEAARARLESAVPQCATGGADIWVRVNRPLWLAVPDVQAAVRSGATGIFIAKAESPDHVRLVLEVAEDEERRIGRREPLKAVTVIESPAAVFRAREVAKAHPRVFGMLGGGEDLATMMDAESSAETLRVPKLMIHLAAKAAGIYSFGTLGSVADFSDTATIRALMDEARRHGFDGATCIHPSVVPIINEAFSPTEHEVGRARALLEAAEAARVRGAGAANFEGKMIDEPVYERARRLLARAERVSGRMAARKP